MEKETVQEKETLFNEECELKIEKVKTINWFFIFILFVCFFIYVYFIK